MLEKETKFPRCEKHILTELEINFTDIILYAILVFKHIYY